VNDSSQHVAKVVIDRWSNLYCVPIDHPAPEDVRHRLDDFVQREVIEACRRRLASLFDAADSDVWLIREIRLDLALDAGAAVKVETAEYWGEKLAREIRRSIEAGADGASLLRFDDRPSYIAQWVRDMSNGSAWDKWYYKSFTSLRSLPTGAAITEGMVREAGLAPRILLSLASTGSLEATLGILSSYDAAKLHRSCAHDSPYDLAGERRWVARLLAVWAGTPLASTGSTAHDALRLFAAVRAEWSDAPDSGLGAAIDGLLNLRNLLQSLGSGDRASTFLAFAATGQFGAARQASAEAGVHSCEEQIAFAARNAEGNADWSALVVDKLCPHDTHSHHFADAFLSDVGGIFLLGESFLRLGIHEGIQRAAEHSQSPHRDEAILRHLLAVRSLGAARAAGSINDPAVRLFSGLDPKVSLNEMSQALQAADVHAAIDTLQAHAEYSGSGTLFDAADAADDAYFGIGLVLSELQLDDDSEAQWNRIARAILRDFRQRRPGFAQCTPEYLFQNFLAGTSAICPTPQGIDVRLPNSALSIVLRISGAYSTYELPWREGVEICLRAPSE